MKTRLTFVLLACATMLPAQTLGGLFKKSTPASSASSVDVGSALTSGAELITFVTIATDQGMKAVSTMIDMYPPEKVEKIKTLCEKYNEASAKRKNGNIQADQVTVATDAGKEMAALQSDWQGYQKEKAANVAKADSHLGLMLGADAIAATTLPKTLQSLQEASKSLGSNPLQASKLGQITAQITILTAVVQHIPEQTKSFTTVRSIAKNIAAAEHVKLAADLKPEQLKDSTSVSSIAKDLDNL